MMVGVPRALLFHQYGDCWTAFLDAAGFEQVVTAPTTADMVVTGGMRADNETCLPVKVFAGHLLDLKGRADVILVPRVISQRRGLKACPNYLGLPDLARSFDLPTMIHTCGSSSWAYEDFIEMGIKAVDTLQPEAVNMSPAYLKKNFGGRLAFHGCISTAGPVTFGSAQDVIDDCRKTLEIMMPGGGYCFAPTHCLQDNSPLENVLAMYETAKKCGAYS